MNAWAKLCATNSTSVLSSLLIYKPDTVESISSEGLNGRVLVADLGGLTVDNAAVPRLVELIKGAPSLEALLLRQVAEGHLKLSDLHPRNRAAAAAASAKGGVVISMRY